MNVEVLAIENQLEAGTLKVRLRVGQQESTVQFLIGETHIGGQPIQTLDYERSFWEDFKFNQHIIFRVMGLVRSRLAGETMEFPIVVGRLYATDGLPAERSAS
jgi:hypothetical protein